MRGVVTDPAPIHMPAAVRAALEQPAMFAPAELLYDEAEDGSIWVVGADWKASFGPAGAVYYPRVGASQRCSIPHVLSPQRVTVGGVPLAFDRGARAVRTGNRIALDRGSFVETYLLDPETVEQCFVLHASPGNGDLVFEIPVASELQTVETDAGLEFRSERGHVTYSRAVAVDAIGRRTSAATRFESHSITIRVEADVLAGAAYPLVVDPVLNTVLIDNTALNVLEVDTAYDPFTAAWVVAYELVFSATDHDIYTKSYATNGTLLGTSFIDASVDSWVRPRIADHANSSKFLVVAGVTASSNGAMTVRGRFTQQVGTTLVVIGSSFSLSNGLTGDCMRPDVGADPFPNSGALFCVVFEHVLPGPTHSDPIRRIANTMVRSDGVVTLGPRELTSGDSDSQPSVSKSNSTRDWMVAWRRANAFTLGDIIGLRISFTGLLLFGPFTISGGSSDDSAPSAASPLDDSFTAAVTWQAGTSTHDVLVALIDGTTVLQTANLMTLENSPTSALDQVQPSIDSDGEHFLVSYSESNASGSVTYVYVTDLAVVGDTLAVVQNHLVLNGSTGPQFRSNVAAARAPGLLDHRYFVVFDITAGTTHDLYGQFFEGLAGGTTAVFCTDTPGACPCGDVGLGVGGCANSVSAMGATLASLGTPSTLSDNMVLYAGGMPPSTTCLFFQGTTAGSPTVFGDGLRCVTGMVVRLAAKSAGSMGETSFPEPGDPALSTSGLVTIDGGTRTYQVWYRNAAAFCTSATFNLTNGVSIGWAR
jgi:hypothetical protein